jgi:hypothetical protein
MYFVTRQHSCIGGRMVEISVGGKNNINPDALSEKYEGEFKEYDNALEAAKVAISIKDIWSKDCEDEINLGVGASLGSIPFDSMLDSDVLLWAYQIELSKLKNIYEPKIIGLLKEITKFLNANEFSLDDDPGEITDVDYTWTVFGKSSKGEVIGIKCSILEEASQYMDSNLYEGINFGFELYKGEKCILNLELYNFTVLCWVNINNEKDLETRWHEFSNEVRTQMWDVITNEIFGRCGFVNLDQLRTDLLALCEDNEVMKKSINDYFDKVVLCQE